MAKRENILPFAPLGKFISDSTGKRVANEAKETAAQILEEATQKIIYKANLLAENAKRKTLKEKDIRLAFNQVKEDL